jgi:hypothetical protein
MASIKESAKNYVSKQTKNIAELKSVETDLNIFTDGKGKDKEGKEFTYNYIEVDGEEYRVPDKVLKDLKAILEKKPSLKTFSVSKQGTGFNTAYTVIPLD